MPAVLFRFESIIVLRFAQKQVLTDTGNCVKTLTNTLVRQTSANHCAPVNFFG